jgi:hypothetical protein
MAKISTTVTRTVILGSAAYGSPLDITASGTIATAQTGQAGVFVPSMLANARIQNDGHIAGSLGGTASGNAGYGINAQSALTLYNAGLIAGGNAATTSKSSEAGGIGVDLRAGGTLKNTGTITGGNSGNNTMQAVSARGGVGVQSHGGSLLNLGTITGGGGGFSAVYSGTRLGGAGGSGVELLDHAIGANKGQITGGLGGFSTSDHVDGNGGAGLQLGASVFTNSGMISGGAGNSQRSPGNGGNGATAFAGAALTNTGTILGGSAGSRPAGVNRPGYYTGKGGIGVAVYGATLHNAGLIKGGFTPGYNSAGIGLLLEGGNVTNSGTILGGGTELQFSGSANGVDLSGGLLVSTGLIMGGQYVNGGNYGFSAGAGVDISSGTLIAAGTITGGSGYASNLPGYASDGTGVYLNGGTLVAEGTISGGLYVGASIPNTLRDAVAFGTLAGTLIIHPGAVFNGEVAATAGAGDVLELAGTAAGTLGGLGTEFTNFATLTVEAGANWTLAGTTALSLDLPVTDDGRLTLATPVTGTGNIALGSGATLTADQSVSGIGISFGGPGHLNLAAPASFASTITAFGAGDTVDLQHLTATTATFAGGTLTLEDGAATVGTLAFAGTFTSNNFSLSADGHGGTVLSYTTGTAALPHDQPAVASLHNFTLSDRPELIPHAHAP